ncbi:MAG: murein biosynthesis integral membrane protein MurJ [Rhodobacteraceae bacterium]|nr:murein biosynthesis integral membrane protein MurJ [Paracoccaceae bacterium]
MAPIRLVSGFLTVGFWTLVSRLAGFGRDILIAAYLGAGPQAQAFLVAFALPNMFRRFFAEGAFNMAFVPLFSKKLEAGEDARDFAEAALAALAAALVALTVIAMVLMPWLVLAMAGGFAGDARLELATLYGRIAFPYILFISLTALLSGVLNATGRFMAAAAAPVLLNAGFIAALLAAARAGWDMGLTLAWTVPVAGVAQLALVWIAAERAGLRLRLRRPRLTPEIRRLAIIALPAALAGGVVQVNLLVGRQVASFYDGAIAWLAYADRLYQLPLGVVGIAIGVVLLPALSRHLRAGDAGAGQAALNQALVVSMALTVPAAVALAVIPGPLISVLFERGAFGAEDARATALALAIYGLGLPAFVLQKVLQPVFYAREDTRSPLRYALWSMLINAVAAVGLAVLIGFSGAAWGTTLAAWAMVFMLWRGARGIGAEVALFPETRRALPRIALASALMGAGLWLAAEALAPALATSGLRYGALAALVLGGAAVYGLAAVAMGAVHPRRMWAAMRRPGASG